jgi:hypothetical protein
MEKKACFEEAFHNVESFQSFSEYIIKSNLSEERKEDMSYLVGIPYINRADLLDNALKSISLYWPHTVVIDNSTQRELGDHPTLSSLVSVYPPPASLTYVQSMNLFQKMAIARDCSVLMYMHTDAEAEQGTPQALLDTIDTLQKEKRKWGVIYTNYDALAAYNMEAVREVGSWDTAFSSYFSDCDWYRRVKLAGYELIDSHLPVFHHGSSSIKSDPHLQAAVSSDFHKWNLYYQQKWGGPPGAEQFHTPWGRVG